tara:strand:- start:596 stop:2131 length:1536 start_codon:yes stop_codon:yes gene_type:complete
MASFNRYQSTLSTYNQRLGTADFRNAAPTVEGEYNSKFTSGLGTDVGQTLNGFQSVTKIENYSGEFKNVLLGLALVKLTETVAGESLTEIFDDAFEGIGSGNANISNVLTATGALAILTGSSPAAGFLKSYYGGSSGLAVGNLLSKATGKDVTSLVSAIQGVHSAGNADQFVAAGLSRSLGAVLSPVISSFNSKVDLAIGTAIAPVLQAVMDISAGPIGLIIDELTGNKLKSIETQGIVSLLAQGRYAEAILLTSNNSSSPYGLIEETLLGIDTRVSTRITYTGSNRINPFGIGQNDNKWEGPATKTWKDPDATDPYNFTRVGGVEELEADFRSATREITELVIHWTGHYLDQDIGAQEIHNTHKEEGYDGIGYHYVIRNGGAIERGRPIQQEGEHAEANGHDKYSIGVAVVGGYTVPSKVGLANPPTGKESFDPKQKQTLYNVIKEFYNVWPGGQVWGHNDTDPQNHADPGFPVGDYIKENFNKVNVSASGTNKPLSTLEITQLRAGELE